MRFESMIEVNAAMHLSYDVESEFNQRGGIMYIAPPGQLKTTAIEIVELFPHARIISNLTVKSLSVMRQDFIGGQLRTMGISDFENIYRRHSSVAANIEGVLMGLVEEGFRAPAFSDQRTSVLPARCAIIGGMSTKCYEERFSAWLDSGFARRFLWSQYYCHRDILKRLEQSIVEWKKFALTNGFDVRVPTRPIKVNLTGDESDKIRRQLRYQPDMRTPFVTAKKIIGVLLWKFQKKPERAWEIWNDFAPSLGKDGALLTL
jgi:hypothetical protein